jgi:phosphoribosyl-AMP cyclohydrolase
MVKTEEGISCHTGRESCFFKQIKKNGDTMNEIEAVKMSPERIYKEKK